MFKLQMTTLLVLLWQLQIVFLVCEPWTCRQTIYLKTQWTVECFRFIAWLYVAICAQDCKAWTSKNLQSKILNIFEVHIPSLWKKKLFIFNFHQWLVKHVVWQWELYLWFSVQFLKKKIFYYTFVFTLKTFEVQRTNEMTH